MNISEPNRPGGMQGGWHRWLIRQIPPSRRCSPRQVQSRSSCYCPGAFLVPFHYISGVETIATQQDKSCPTASEPEPGPHGSHVPGPSRGLTPPPGPSSLPQSSLPDIPLSGTSLVGWLFPSFLAVSSQRKWDNSPSGSPDHHTKRTMSAPKMLSLGVSTAPHGAMIIGLTLHQKPDLALGNKDKSPPAPSSSHIRGLADPWWWGGHRQPKEHQRPDILRLRLIKGKHGWLWPRHSLWGPPLLLRY